jgi:hypothetical protein
VNPGQVLTEPDTEGVLALFAREGLISAAKVAVLNLEGIKTALGPKWQRVESLVLAYFDQAIKQSLKPGDVYFKRSELGYVVICPDLSVEETQAKCAALSREICRHLFGEEGIEVAMRNCIGQVDRAWLRKYKNVIAVIDYALETRGKATVITREKSRDEEPSSPLGLDFSSAEDRQDSNAELSFVYRPLWDSATRRIDTYLCQPIRSKSASASPLGNAQFLSAAGDAACALLDRTVLAHCATRLRTIPGDGARPILAVPLHFSTLARGVPWNMFGQVYREIPQNILRELAFVVFGLDGVPNVRLMQELPKLSLARHILCVAEPDGAIAARFAFVRAHAIGVQLPETHWHGRPVMRSLAADARRNGQQSFVLGVSGSSTGAHAIAGGVRYLEGPAIHPAVTDPFAISPYEPDWSASARLLNVTAAKRAT